MIVPKRRHTRKKGSAYLRGRKKRRNGKRRGGKEAKGGGQEEGGDCSTRKQGDGQRREKGKTRAAARVKNNHPPHWAQLPLEGTLAPALWVHGRSVHGRLGARRAPYATARKKGRK